MKIYIYSQSISNARKEAEKIKRETGGKMFFQDGMFIIHTPAGESEFTGLKNMNSPEPGQSNTAQVIE